MFAYDANNPPTSMVDAAVPPRYTGVGELGSEDVVSNAFIYPINKQVENGDVDEVQRLLGLGVAIDETNEHKQTAFTQAAYHGRLEIIRLLVNQRADGNHQDRYGFTPLHYAVQEGHLEASLCLLEKGADPNIASRYGVTPLMEAARHGNREMIDLLLRFNADPKSKAFSGETAAHFAFQNEFYSLVKYLAPLCDYDPEP